MDDTAQLEELNEQFIEAFRRGSWELLEPILAPAFSYLDGATGEVWKHERYVDGLRSHPAAGARPRPGGDSRRRRRGDRVRPHVAAGRSPPTVSGHV
jgi:hypothetical protein